MRLEPHAAARSGAARARSQAEAACRSRARSRSGTPCAPRATSARRRSRRIELASGRRVARAPKRRRAPLGDAGGAARAVSTRSLNALMTAVSSNAAPICATPTPCADLRRAGRRGCAANASVSRRWRGSGHESGRSAKGIRRNLIRTRHPAIGQASRHCNRNSDDVSNWLLLSVTCMLVRSGAGRSGVGIGENRCRLRAAANRRGARLQNSLRQHSTLPTISTSLSGISSLG